MDDILLFVVLRMSDLGFLSVPEMRSVLSAVPHVGENCKVYKVYQTDEADAVHQLFSE